MTRRKWSEITPIWDAARVAGHSMFFPPHPCAKGHTSPRRTSNGVCIACSEEHSKRASIKADKRMMLPAEGTKTLQINQDDQTASLEAATRERFRELVGRPVSRSIVHKAAIALLATNIQRDLTATQLHELLR